MNILKEISEAVSVKEFDDLVTEIEKLEKKIGTNLDFDELGGRATKWMEVPVKPHGEEHFVVFRATKIGKMIDYLKTGFYTGTQCYDTISPKAKWFITSNETAVYFSKDFEYVKNMYLKESRVLQIGDDESFNNVQFILKCAIRKTCQGIRLCPNSEIFIKRKDSEEGIRPEIISSHTEDEMLIVRNEAKKQINKDDVFVTSLYVRVLNRNVTNEEVQEVPELFVSKVSKEHWCVWGEWVIRHGGFSFKKWVCGKEQEEEEEEEEEGEMSSVIPRIWKEMWMKAKCTFKWPEVESIEWLI